MDNKFFLFCVCSGVMGVSVVLGDGGGAAGETAPKEVAVATQAVGAKETADKTDKPVAHEAKQAAEKKVETDEDTQKKETSFSPISRYSVDQVAVVIYAQEGTEIITESDLSRPSLEGMPRTIEDIIFERRLYLDAKKYKMIADEDAIDKQFATLQRQNNMTLDDLKAVFRSSGYTYEEGREQFAIMYAVNSIVDFKVRSRLVVPEKDVRAYYDAHPVELEPSYQLQRAVVPYGAVESKQALQEELANFSGLGISWQEPFWVDRTDLAESKLYLIDMKVGAVSAPEETDAGYELVRLVNKKEERLAPFEERYREIVDILRKPKYDQLMAEYKQHLLDTASIVYIKKELAPQSGSTVSKKEPQEKKRKQK